ncbi:MAG: hypothetical protein IIA83_02135 [Thaumarchaeota archaeon]|nr:hypothetical protein [Nitrososphaerota archaeon]
MQNGINDLKKFFNECQKIDQKLKQIHQNLSYPDNDNRKSCFGVLHSQMLHYEIMLKIMYAKVNRSLPDHIFKDVIGIGIEEQAYWENFQVTSKVSYITLSHFVIENMFKTLLAELDTSKNPSTGFYNITKVLLDKISVPDKPRKLEILNAMAMIRNSMHNNGIHAPVPPAPDSQTITIGNTVLRFDKGNPTDLLETQMVDLINAVIDILKEIVNSTEVQQLPSVPNLFVPKF